MNPRFRVTVAGSSSSIPRPARACSSYLVDDGASKIVLDLGSGAFANVRLHVDFASIGAVVISHMHADHFIDLIPLRYALRYGLEAPKKIPLYLPPGGEAILRRLTDAFVNEGGDFLSDVFDVANYDPTRELRLRESVLRFAPTRHYIPAFAIRAESEGRAVTYSADTAPTPAVVELAAGSDVFICESTLADGAHENGSLRGHSSAREAGTMAHDAGVGRLYLTHYTGEVAAGDLMNEAAETFGAAVNVVDDNTAIDIH